MTPPSAGSPTPHEVSDELRRVVGRWHQLPLDHALSHVPAVRALVQALADRVATARGVPTTAVPDLGPAVVMDQLAVMVHDVLAADPDVDPAVLVDALAGIRRGL
ncbi:hypothetical protein GCM10023258_11870 [Terrabacter aeriphilus]|uniref:MftR C-terminal domain-containing protein n=1 Tax=Terrabacter aeriphilus TaxID=515662 RepID=A0ABP9J7Z0_9MICO